MTTKETSTFYLRQRWANSVLRTEYEYEYYSVAQKWPNTNTNIIRFPKNDRIRIQILFGFPKMTKYEYEYYSVSQNWPNTTTNIIWLPRNDLIRIWILFCFPIMIEYLASQKWLNTIYKYKLCWALQKESLQDQFWVSQGDAKFAESSDNWS